MFWIFILEQYYILNIQKSTLILESSIKYAKINSKRYPFTLKEVSMIKLISPFIFLAILTSLLFSRECPNDINHSYLNIKYIGAKGNGENDDTAAIQHTIDCGVKYHTPVYIPAGKYRITHPLILKTGLILYGAGRFSQLLIESPIAFTMQNNEGADFLHIHDFSLVYQHPTPSSKHTAFILKSHRHSLFENLYFYNFKNQTICKLQPKYQGKPAHNITFNSYRNWYVDTCRIGVVYQGLGKSGQKNPISIISNNRWYDITFRHVKESAIQAVSWADSERWYNLYAQATSLNTILVNLNTSAITWNQIDRFHFYSPVLVYAPKLKNNPNLNVKAFRFGKGTFRHLVLGLITDKVWQNGIIEDDNARSYYILGNSGKGFYAQPIILQKNYSSTIQLPSTP